MKARNDNYLRARASNAEVLAVTNRLAAAAARLDLGVSLGHGGRRDEVLGAKFAAAQPLVADLVARALPGDELGFGSGSCSREGGEESGEGEDGEFHVVRMF